MASLGFQVCRLLRYSLFIYVVFCISGCSNRYAFKKQNKLLSNIIASEFAKSGGHHGILFKDISTGQIIYEKESQKYFTPASNTKILTYYCAQKTLGDSLITFEYYRNQDSLFIRGLADPSFLNKKYPENKHIFSFLKDTSVHLVIVERQLDCPTYGAGWSWDDASFAYQPERSTFPIFGNLFRVEKKNDSLQFDPRFFKNLISQNDSIRYPIKRFNENSFEINSHSSYHNSERNIPFSPDIITVQKLLSEELSREVSISNHKTTIREWKNMYSTPVDSAFRLLLQDSDNFTAEQLLLQCSYILNHNFSTEDAIDSLQKKHLSDLPDKPIWVDGSGLSRYNLNTPRSLIKLLEKIYNEQGWEKLNYSFQLAESPGQ